MPQLDVLAFELLEPRAFVRRQPGPPTTVTLGLPHLAPQRLGRTPDLLGLAVTPSSQGMEPPRIPGRFRCRILGEAVQAATGAGDAPISVNDKGGNLPPLRRNTYTCEPRIISACAGA